MLNTEQKDPFQDLRKTANRFFENNTAAESSDLLSVLLDSFITNNEFDNLTKANASSLIMGIQKMIFQGETAIRTEAESAKRTVRENQLITTN